MHPLFEQLKLRLGYYEVPPERKVDLQNVIAEIALRVAKFLGEPAWSEYQDAGEVIDYGSMLFKDQATIDEFPLYEYMIFRRRRGESNADSAPD